MFSSTVLDLAIGIIFCFLTASLATGTVVEALSSVVNWRAKTLMTGIQQLLNDKDLQGLAGQLYNHALINPRAPGAPPTAPAAAAGGPGAPVPASAQAAAKAAKKFAPSYIDRQLFARAMMDITGMSLHFAAAAAAGSLPSVGALYAQIQTTVDKAQNPQIHDFLVGVVDRCGNDAVKIQGEISAWFDHAMDRVSGVYKRQAQLIGFVIALVLAGLFNIDAIAAAKTLWMQPTAAAKLVATTTTTADDALKQLTAALPIGWPNGFWTLAKGQEWVWAIVGWFITAFSTLFGAPFWFDLLQSIVRLKGSGPSPKEKADGRGAAA